MLILYLFVTPFSYNCQEAIIREAQGNIVGLKPNQKKRLANLHRRKIPRNCIAPVHFLRAIVELSHEIERQIGVLIDRKGGIRMVIVGDSNQIFIPDLGRQRVGQSRFRGLRLIHTHLREEPLSRDDLNDLSVLRLDMIMSVGVTPNGTPGASYYAHLLPKNPDGKLWQVEGPSTVHDLEKEDFLELIDSLEGEFAQARPAGSDVQVGKRAILVGVYSFKNRNVDEQMDELHELARSAGLYVLSRVIQRRDKPDPRFLLGQGKLADLILRAMQVEADLLIFDTDLTPTQSRNIAEKTDLLILDRTQLILDIFAQRAHSRDGKIQVELAQLKYLLPRLNRMNKAMSRLTGGIGGRGPGETKLEINRRRARDKITRLEKQLKQVQKRRKVRRQQRKRHQVPIVSIVGYTNAGKSTLINNLTKSEVLSEDRMFSTLDPVSRRLRFPQEREIVLTDTVGFIRDLPSELMAAFHATLEELADADLLLHVVDIHDPAYEEQIQSVRRILSQLELEGIPSILAFNKSELLPKEEVEALARRHQAIPISAMNRETLRPLLEEIGDRLWSSRLAQNKTTHALQFFDEEYGGGHRELSHEDEAIPEVLPESEESREAPLEKRV